MLPGIQPVVSIVGATGMPHDWEFTDETATPAADEAATAGGRAWVQVHGGMGPQHQALHRQRLS